MPPCTASAAGDALAGSPWLGWQCLSWAWRQQPLWRKQRGLPAGRPPDPPGHKPAPGGSGSQPATSPTTPGRGHEDPQRRRSYVDGDHLRKPAPRHRRTWQIPGTPAGAGSIAGFASTTYAAAGQTVELHVTTTAPTFQAAAYRMGWYQGLGGRLVWASPEVTGRTQPPCQVTPGVNMVSCDNWSVSLRIPITAAFIQGDYLIKLIGSGHQESYIPLTIWDPHSTADLVVNRSLTEEGWNTYGGFSYYQGVGGSHWARPAAILRATGLASCPSIAPMRPATALLIFWPTSIPSSGLWSSAAWMPPMSRISPLTPTPPPSCSTRLCSRLATTRRGPSNERQGAQATFQHGVNLVFFGAAAVLRHSRPALRAGPRPPGGRLPGFLGRPPRPRRRPYTGHGKHLEFAAYQLVRDRVSWRSL